MRTSATNPQVNAASAPPATYQAIVSSKSAKIDKEQGEDLYKDMYLGRLFEDTCAQMYYRGKMFGFVHLYCGQEAVSTGVIRQLEARDYVCSTYRDHVHALSKGVHPNAVRTRP
jgi:pyruvate dehydrogenase E1 component alpha subunit